MICIPKVRHFWRCIFFMAKKGSKQKKYSTEFKIGVIMDMREHHLGYRETARKHFDAKSRSEEERYKDSIRRWERIFLEEGACVHFEFFARFILIIQACFLRILPQSRIRSTAPSRREPFSQTHSSLVFCLIYNHRQSLFRTTRLSRGFLYTRKSS